MHIRRECLVVVFTSEGFLAPDGHRAGFPSGKRRVAVWVVQNHLNYRRSLCGEVAALRQVAEDDGLKSLPAVIALTIVIGHVHGTSVVAQGVRQTSRPRVGGLAQRVEQKLVLFQIYHLAYVLAVLRRSSAYFLSCAHGVADSHHGFLEWHLRHAVFVVISLIVVRVKLIAFDVERIGGHFLENGIVERVVDSAVCIDSIEVRGPHLFSGGNLVFAYGFTKDALGKQVLRSVLLPDAENGIGVERQFHSGHIVEVAEPAVLSRDTIL